MLGREFRLPAGQGDGHSETAARSVAYRQRPPVTLNDVAGDGEAQPRARNGPAARSIEPAERRKRFFDPVLGDAWPAIVY